jgi:hypothetical protein
MCWKLCSMCCRFMGGVWCILEAVGLTSICWRVLEVMRCLLLCMLVAVKVEPCLLEVLEVMRCVLLCMLEIVEVEYVLFTLSQFLFD